MKLAIDASVAVAAAANPLGFQRFRRFELIAPPLMWIESLSTLHAMQWRGELRSEQAEPMRDRLLAAPVSRREPDGQVPARDFGCAYAAWDCAAGFCDWADRDLRRAC